MAGRAEARRLHHNLERLQRYIHRVATRTGWKSIMFGAEDIVQECTIVLWKVITKYPEAKGSELIKLFKRSLIRHLASIFRLEHIRRSMGTIHLSSLSHGSDQGGGDEGSSWVDKVISSGMYSSEYTILPWSFYKMQIRMIEKRIGKARLAAMIEGRNFGRGFEARKEAVLKSIE